MHQFTVKCICSQRVCTVDFGKLWYRQSWEVIFFLISANWAILKMSLGNPHLSLLHKGMWRLSPGYKTNCLSWKNYQNRWNPHHQLCQVQLGRKFRTNHRWVFYGVEQESKLGFAICLRMGVRDRRIVTL